MIAGQGTVGLEILRDRPDLDALVIAVGGGGLVSGVAVAARALAPGIEIVGVQSARFPSMPAATGRWSEGVPGGATIAEGIAVAVPGRRTRAHVEALVDDVVVVGEDRIETAITLLLQIEKTLTEGAGAAGLAAVLADPARYKGRRVGLILCGGNIDTVVHDRSFLATDAKSARVEVEVELADPLLRAAMERALGEQGFVVEGGR